MYEKISYFLQVLGFIILFISFSDEEKTQQRKQKNLSYFGNKVAAKLPNYARRFSHHF